jgi:FkbM family methyltransferase
MKKIIFNFLCNNITGTIISIIFNYNIPNIRFGWKRFKTPKGYCNNTVRAMIFFGFYESAEMRLVQSHLNKELPIIELGSSLGVVSSVVNHNISNNVRYTCIEANPYLIDYIKFNIQKHNPTKTNYTIINAAIAYKTTLTIQMNISNNNTESSLVNKMGNANLQLVTVPTISLINFSNEPYTLICDIEGAEIEVFKNDKIALEQCKNLLIELHETQYNNKKYSVEELKEIITKELGFSLVIEDGNVFYYKK